jgi:sulfate transporter 4
MFAVASNHLGPHWSESRAEVDDPSGVLEEGKHTEVQALDEKKSQVVAQILQARHTQVRKPVKAFGKKIACSEPETSDVNPKPTPQDTISTAMVRALSQRLPVLTWVYAMTCKVFRADLIAGATVGVMAIPQSMSYARIAGLPYVFGMYSACVPTIVYAIFGQSRQLAVGPVAMVSLLVEAGLRGKLDEEQCPAWYARGEAEQERAQYEYCPEAYTQLAILTATIVGVIQIVASLLRLGFIVSFLGHPVASGFTSGAAIIIGLSQVKYIVGFDVAKSEYAYETLWNLAANLQHVQPMTLCLGLSWLAGLLLIKKAAQKYKSLSLLGAMGPLLSCLAGTLLLWLCSPLRDEFQVDFVGDIDGGLFPVSIHQWQLGDIPKVLPTAITACIIGYMESIAISKNLAAKHGYEVEAGQELLALGMSNLIGSMFSSYPVTGSFSRSAVNNSTGALSQLSGLITGLVMLLTLLLLTPLFYYLPQFVLAAIVISSVMSLVAFGEAHRLWRVKKQDFSLWIVAFIGTLFLGILLGIGIAVGLSLCIIIYESVRPQITILWRIPGTTIYRNMKQETSGSFVPNVFIARVGSSMYFANASFIKDMLLAYIADLAEVNPTEYLVLEMTPVVSIDTAAVHSLQDIVHHFRSHGIHVAFAMVGNRVEKTMRKSKLIEFVGEQWFFPTVNGAVHYCLQHQRCKKLSQKQDPNIEASVGCDDIDVSTCVDVHPGNEIGFSNDHHHECTAVFINYLHSKSQEHPIVGSVLAALHVADISAVKTQVESFDEGHEKHFYLLKDAKSQSKLSDARIEEIRELLAPLFAFVDHESTFDGSVDSKKTPDSKNPSNETVNSSCS